MPLLKRAGSPYWYIRFSLGGRDIFESSKTTNRKEAQQLEHSLRERVWRELKLGETPAKTWEEAVAEWSLRKASKRSLKRDTQIFDIASEVWKGKRLDQITSEEVAKYTRTLLQHTSPGNTNRHLSQLRAFFRASVEWQLVGSMPTVKLVSAPDFEPTIISREQFNAFLTQLPGHIIPLAKFGAATGLRYSNVARLRWERFGNDPYINVEAATVTVPSTSAKAARPIHIPISTAALDIVRDMERSKSGYVFVDHLGRAPVGSVKTAWHNARARAGLPRLRFHDLRHAWASWHLQEGTPSRIVQELGAWASPSMVKRYGHLQIEHLKAYVK